MRHLQMMGVLLLAIAVTGCVVRDSLDDDRGARRQADMRHAEAMDRLVPEDGAMRPARLRAVIEAIRTVRPDIPNDELPVNFRAVRNVMKGMSYAELRRVEAILPSVEKRRAERGDD